MAKVDEVTTAIQKQNENPIQSLKTMIEQSAKELGKALPEHMRPERIVRIALTCIRLNPELANCTPASFLGALFTAAQIGIEPVGGRAYLLPFNNNRKIGNTCKTIKEVQFVMGYKGVTELFYRHEKAISIRWSPVKEKDEFKFEYGTSEYLKHIPARGDRGKTIGFWALAKLAGGGTPFLYMTVEECMEHAKKHSKSFNKKEGKFVDSSPWITEPDSMCLKTVFVQLAKTLPLSVEVQRALGTDESSREYRKEIDDALDLPDQTSWAEAEVLDEATEQIQPPPTNGNVNNTSEMPKNEDFQNSVNKYKSKLTEEEFKGVLQVFGVTNEIEITLAQREPFIKQLKKRIEIKEKK